MQGGVGTTSPNGTLLPATPVETAAPVPASGLSVLLWRAWHVLAALVAPSPSSPPAVVEPLPPPTALEHAVRVWGTAGVVRGGGRPARVAAALQGRTPLSRGR
jgi:hypothetical protein